MSDNTQLNVGVAGDIIRDIDRGSSIKTQVVALDAGGAAGESLVTLTNPMPVASSATNFIASAGNSSTAQLGAGATFTGAIESVLSQVALSLLIDTDQICSVTINQYVTSSSASLISSWTYPVFGTGFSRSFTLNGNYCNVVVTNTSASATTTLNINTYYGTIDSVTQLGNRPMAINEVGGTAIGPTIPVNLAAHQDAFGRIAIAQRQNDFECAFAGNVNMASLISSTQSGSASITQANGQALFSTGATPGTIEARSIGNVNYRPGAELYAYFTAYWADNAVGTYQRIGLYDANNGFYIGYEGTAWGISSRTGGSDTHVAQASFNGDTLTGAPNSQFTRNGVPEAIDFTHQNVYRLRFGWVGSAPVIFEVLSPDGGWVVFHTIRQPNLQPTPSIQNPSLPMSVSMSDTGTSCTIGTSCWCAGSSSQFNMLNQPVTASTLALQTHSVVQGKTITGTYVDQQVDANGAVVMSPASTVSIKELQDARAAEGALANYLTGDPNGDFAGVDFLSALFDDSQGLAARTKITNLPMQDVKGAQMVSDAPAPITIGGPVGTLNIIDTTGYQSINVSTLAYAGNVFSSDDLINWQALNGIGRTIVINYVVSIAANNGYSFPCLGRYIKFTCTTAGFATVYLRSAPWVAAYTTNLNNNLALVGGGSTVTTNVAGMLAVGGNIATGTSPTANPVHIAGLDTAGKTRPPLVDTAGRAILATDPQAVNRTLSTDQSGALNVKLPTADNATDSIVELLTKILIHLRINGTYLQQLPAILAASTLQVTAQPIQLDEDTVLREDPMWSN